MTALSSLALLLDSAEQKGAPVAQLTTRRVLSVDDAYAVQRDGILLRASRGDRPVGVKLGFTSSAKARQMGVSDVIIGVLTESMWLEDQQHLDPSGLIHPRIEPEIAFLLGRIPASRSGTCDATQMVSHVAPAMEIIDSRYENFRFAVEDVIADNTSAARFVVGPWRPLAAVRDGLDNLGVLIRVDDELVDTGSTAAILGDPMRALSAAARLSAAHGLPLPPGSIVLAGAATAAQPLPTAGRTTVRTSIADLGRVSVVVGTSDV